MSLNLTYVPFAQSFEPYLVGEWLVDGVLVDFSTSFRSNRVVHHGVVASDGSVISTFSFDASEYSDVLLYDTQLHSELWSSLIEFELQRRGVDADVDVYNEADRCLIDVDGADRRLLVRVAHDGAVSSWAMSTTAGDGALGTSEDFDLERVIERFSA